MALVGHLDAEGHRHHAHDGGPARCSRELVISSRGGGARSAEAASEGAPTSRLRPRGAEAKRPAGRSSLSDMAKWPENPDDPVDPAFAPLIEAGEGEAEGFDVAEADLIRHTEHGDEHGT